LVAQAANVKYNKVYSFTIPGMWQFPEISDFQMIRFSETQLYLTKAGTPGCRNKKCSYRYFDTSTHFERGARAKAAMFSSHVTESFRQRNAKELKVKTRFDI